MFVAHPVNTCPNPICGSRLAPKVVTIFNSRLRETYGSNFDLFLNKNYSGNYVSPMYKKLVAIAFSLARDLTQLQQVRHFTCALYEPSQEGTVRVDGLVAEGAQWRNHAARCNRYLMRPR